MKNDLPDVLPAASAGHSSSKSWQQLPSKRQNFSQLHVDFPRPHEPRQESPARYSHSTSKSLQQSPVERQFLSQLHFDVHCSHEPKQDASKSNSISAVVPFPFLLPPT